MDIDTNLEPLTDDELDKIRARVDAAKPRPPYWRKPLLAAGEMRRHAEADVLRLLDEVDRLRLMVCEHPEIELGNCVVCGNNVPPEDTDLRYTPEPRQIYPREVLSIKDFDLINELIEFAAERREQQARSDVFEASYHRSRIKDYRKFYAKLRR